MKGAIGGSSSYAPVDLTEGASPDLSSLVAVRHPGPVSNSLGLYPTHIPQLGAAVIGEGSEDGAVRQYP